MDVKHIHWLGHSSFRIEDGQHQIYIDPWKIPPSSPPADLVLITHRHDDHFSPGDLRSILRETSIVAVTPDIHESLSGTKVTVEPGKSYTLGGWSVETVPAYNEGKKFHPRAKGWVGYILTLSSGMRIYHAGDTDVIPEMKQIKADVALLPCGGTYTMTADEAAQAANVMRPSVVIPIHWGDIVGSRADAEQLSKLFDGETTILDPER